MKLSCIAVNCSTLPLRLHPNGRGASLDNFIRQWSKEEKKEKIKEMLLECGIDLGLMKADQNMTDVDDFDFICHMAFDKKSLTRK